jgi:hypothetical protein
MAHAHVEILSAVVRVFPDGKAYGDAYELLITVRGLDPETVEIVGAAKAPTGEQIRAIRKALNAMGIRKAIWKRFRLGGKHTAEVT